MQDLQEGIQDGITYTDTLMMFLVMLLVMEKVLRNEAVTVNMVVLGLLGYCQLLQILSSMRKRP